MMIGEYIRGIDLNGKKCEGTIIDSIICPQFITIQSPANLQKQIVPIPCTGYLVESNEGGLHVVSPMGITEIMTSAATVLHEA